jgi:hypothetical protein
MASTTRPRTRRETKPAAPEETPKVEPDETPETGPAETPTTGPDETKAETPTERLAKPTVALTAEVLAQLRRPFTPEAIRFKPQTVTKDQKKAMATFYIDARLVAERLNAVLGPDAWEDDYRLLVDHTPEAFKRLHFPVECRLTVAGVTKVDVGNYQKPEPDDKAMKSAYSDALKRAAVKFGIGAYLYGLPKLWEETKVGGNGKAQGFSDAAERRLRAGYVKAIEKMGLGDPLDHGDVGDDPDVTPEPEPDVDPKDVATPDDLAELAALAKAKGFDRDGFVAVVKPHRDENDGNVLKSWIAERTAELEAMPDKDPEGGDEGNA